MSAAAPLPPPYNHTNSEINGRASDTTGEGSDNWGKGSNEANRVGGQPPHGWPHLKDLSVRAQERIQLPMTINQCVEKAQEAARQADVYLTYRRPDLAYIEYLVACQIVANKIPHNKDLPLLKESRGSLHQRHKELVKQLHSQQERFDNIKEIIISDNTRNGTQPTIHSAAYDIPGLSSTLNGLPETQFSVLAPESMGTPRPSGRSSAIREISPRVSLDMLESTVLNRSSPVILNPARPKPPISPKPKNLHGRVISQDAMLNSVAPDPSDLNARFARLRSINSGPDSQILTTQTPSAGEVKMPSPTDFNGASLESFPLRPMGPREMPKSTFGPPPPPKLPLDPSYAVSMPKAPSPTYSPARNMQTPASIDPPRTTARSMVGTGGRSNSMVSSVASAPPGSSGDIDSYFPPTSEGATGTRPRQKSVHMRRELQITSEKLYDYLRRYNVLLIDVRSREDYDEGHIYVRSIMCIEPELLTEGMSAEQLVDRLILSPDVELDMFHQRGAFDLVVYYDQSTPSASFVNRPVRTENETTLKLLYNTLWLFNQEQPLQSPPVLLIGGLDAWVDLVGQQALISTNTTATVSAKRSRPSRKASLPSYGSSFHVPKKLRVYNPMDAEEEKKWRETVRSERPSLPAEASEDDGDFTIYRTAEDFLRRYPEAHEIEKQSMVVPRPRPAPPSQPSYIPPPVPTVPSRPPPAVPRVNYSGVHDRDISPFSTSNRMVHLPAYIPPSHLPRFQKVPKTGLINFGVTCYMNSTIQSLNATLPLSRVFLNGDYTSWIQRENWKGAKGLMAETYANLLQNLWKGDVLACRPSTMRKLCTRFNKEWGIDRQQDAKEFLEFLIDLLHEDLNTNWSHPPLKALSPLEEASRERFPKPYAAWIEWERYIKREKSIITDLFAGQHASRLRCMTCSHTSTTYEAFYSISVEIPRDRPAHIRDCLRSYCTEEKLDGDEVWKCPNCQKEREASKKITITRAPIYLVLHLKRFSASHLERARKVRTPIEFPLEGFDLGPFVAAQTTLEEEEFIRGQRDGSNTLALIKDDISMNPPYIYNAYAVIRHLGTTLTSGHYISLVKDTGRNIWRQFNDDRVNDFDPNNLRSGERLQNDQAYIVFYERVKLPAQI